jgi:hypothetical protein
MGCEHQSIDRKSAILRATCRVALAMLFSSAVSATDLRGRIEGQSQHSKVPFAVNGMRVELVNQAGQPVANYLTGPDGMYYFRNVSPGNYLVRVRGRSYALTVQPRPSQDVGPIRTQY